MTTWISTHGIGAITDTKSTFVITANSGSATIKPTDPNALQGWVHFVLPSPPVNNPNLQVLAVDFSSQNASVESVSVWLANKEVFTANNLQKGQSFDVNVASSSAVYTGKGIAVSVFLSFNNVASTLRFQSVAIQV